MTSKYIKILILENLIEAQLLEPELIAQQIPYKMMRYSDLAYDGLFTIQKGWGSLEAPKEYREKIIEITTALFSGD